MIPEVSPNFAHHRWNRERHEISAFGCVESIDRLHQADTRDLNEVVQRFAAPTEVTRDMVRQWQAPCDDRLALAATSRRSWLELFECREHREHVLVLVTEGAT